MTDLAETVKRTDVAGYKLPWTADRSGGHVRVLDADGKSIALADFGSKNDALWSEIVAILAELARVTGDLAFSEASKASLSTTLGDVLKDAHAKITSLERELARVTGERDAARAEIARLTTKPITIFTGEP